MLEDKYYEKIWRMLRGKGVFGSEISCYTCQIVCIWHTCQIEFWEIALFPTPTLWALVSSSD